MTRPSWEGGGSDEDSRYRTAGLLAAPRRFRPARRVAQNARVAEVALTGNRVRRLLLDGADLEVFGGIAAVRGWDKNAANEMGNTRKDT